MDDNRENMPVSEIIGDFVFLFASMFSSGWYYYSKCHPNTTELVHQTLELNPGFDVKKWDEIASRTNFFLYETHGWSTPYFFFSGQDAKITF